MSKETTLRLESYFLAFIEEMVAKGRFSAPNRRGAGRLAPARRERVAHGNSSHRPEGEDSGWINDFSLDGFFAEMHKETRGKKVSDAA